MVHATRGKVPVLFDGGVRRGTDVFKALALGAKAVLVSPRPKLQPMNEHLHCYAAQQSATSPQSLVHLL